MGAAVAAVTEPLSPPPPPVVRECVCACVRTSVCLRAAPGLYYIHQGVGGGGEGEGLGEVAEEGEQEGGERVPEEAAAEEGQVISPTGRAWLWAAQGGRRKGRPRRGPGEEEMDIGEGRRSGDLAAKWRAGDHSRPQDEEEREQSSGERKWLADGGRRGGKGPAITS